ncbi:uncharacterized protein SPPG_04311 [Spizellomyces punctatus DAOM BR117]|uniref:Uncharacterized protein n=1 Tax=Spizellomyces punctatus (strain DAOM BR117) TaxID=645134 RepID=A0A0L0HK09_SPIPD|nr:uncharacterized protein SPPG_04311 [Spizellomyces punctatus DAOM BR117]KND01220.1 hypothetical protein SPPG_04311 [Spizellomyces punctatus DAOM BR117]|eukprot:XP_016609259.1 hypothetical protein SPPG_04311 [Spizellomyces punctatus DAOM BR117]
MRYNVRWRLCGLVQQRRARPTGFPVAASKVRLFSGRPHEHIDTSHPSYNHSNAEWTVLALDHPLTHAQTGVKIHLVGIHHNSPASLERVEYVMDQVTPAAVCLEIDADRLKSYSAKAEVVLGRYKSQHSGASISPLSPEDLANRAPLSSSRLSGVRTVLSPTSGGTGSSPALSLTEHDHETLTRLGIDPALHLSPTHLHYGLEIGVAVRSAHTHNAVIRSIDIHPDILRSDPSHSTLINDLIRRFRLLPPPIRGTSMLGRGLFWLITRLSFGVKRDVAKEAQADVCSVKDHATYLRCWKTFHPNAYFWWLEVRNAGMVNGIRTCVRDVAESAGLLSATDKSHAKEPPAIVVVVGKSHVFGIAEMWADKVEQEKFPLIKDGMERKLVGEEVIFLDEMIADAMKAEEEAIMAAEAVRNGKTDSGAGAVRILVHEREQTGGSEVADTQKSDADEARTGKKRRSGHVPAPAPPPVRPPPRQPTGIRYVD